MGMCSQGMLCSHPGQPAAGARCSSWPHSAMGQGQGSRVCSQCAQCPQHGTRWEGAGWGARWGGLTERQAQGLRAPEQRQPEEELLTSSTEPRGARRKQPSCNAGAGQALLCALQLLRQERAQTYVGLGEEAARSRAPDSHIWKGSAGGCRREPSPAPSPTPGQGGGAADAAGGDGHRHVVHMDAQGQGMHREHRDAHGCTGMHRDRACTQCTRCTGMCRGA